MTKTVTPLQVQALELLYNAAPRLVSRHDYLASELKAEGYTHVRLGDVDESWTTKAEDRALRPAFRALEAAGFVLRPTDKGVGIELR